MGRAESPHWVFHTLPEINRRGSSDVRKVKGNQPDKRADSPAGWIDLGVDPGSRSICQANRTGRWDEGQHTHCHWQLDLFPSVQA